MFKIKGKYSTAKVMTNNCEAEAIGQILNLCNQAAFADSKIRIMPDVHSGKGCVIGFTANLGEKVIPNLVGVDIGCGVVSVCVGRVDVDFEKLDEVIHQYIPAGASVHQGDKVDSKRVWENYISSISFVNELPDKIVDRLCRSMGTLGGGNHYLELGVDELGNYWLTVHTGSRNLGVQVCKYYQAMAEKDIAATMEVHKAIIKDRIAQLKAAGYVTEIPVYLEKVNKLHDSLKVPKELSYLVEEHRDMYLKDMKICQAFAETNRETILSIIVSKMGWHIEDRVSSIHNYINFSDNIIRKGAISAKKGEKVIIPLNMRDGAIIGIGKGNEDWNNSAPHGAGRAMSRSEAKASIDLADYVETMKGIYSTTVNTHTIDEAPFAYKPSEEIIELVQDTVDIKHIVKPVYNFKAAD